jgi:hypothetical protein
LHSKTAAARLCSAKKSKVFALASRLFRSFLPLSRIVLAKIFCSPESDHADEVEWGRGFACPHQPVGGRGLHPAYLLPRAPMLLAITRVASDAISQKLPALRRSQQVRPVFSI